MSDEKIVVDNPEIVGKVPQTEQDAFEEILKALGGVAAPNQGSGNQRDKKVDPPQDLPGEALIMLIEFTTVKLCRMYAAKFKIKWTDKLARSVNITATERASLRTFAPYAADFLKFILIHFKYIGAILFLVTYWSVLSDKFGVVKDAMSPEQKAKIEAEIEKRRKEKEEKK